MNVCKEIEKQIALLREHAHWLRTHLEHPRAADKLGARVADLKRIRDNLRTSPVVTTLPEIEVGSLWETVAPSGGDRGKVVVETSSEDVWYHWTTAPSSTQRCTKERFLQRFLLLAAPSEKVPCPRCGSPVWVVERDRGDYQRQQELCPHCRGKGTIPASPAEAKTHIARHRHRGTGQVWTWAPWGWCCLDDQLERAERMTEDDAWEKAIGDGATALSWAEHYDRWAEKVPTSTSTPTP